MVRVFYIQDERVQWEKFTDELELDSSKQYIWIDLESPADEERKQIEAFFSVVLQTSQEAEEIESSSRYSEDPSCIKANSGFITDEVHFDVLQVSFLLLEETLFTVRDSSIHSFGETVRKLKVSHRTIKSGVQVWMMLLETRIDADADYIENLSRTTNAVSQEIQKQKDFGQSTLIRITELQENSILIRESIIDKQRLISALLKSQFIQDIERERLRVIMKDVISLIQHTQFSFERLEYLQDTFLGLVNIEQNKIIKIFTVASVVFMPPTLIASIYGMNFAVMPELQWKAGYPIAWTLMIMSSTLTLWYFKRKKWL